MRLEVRAARADNDTTPKEHFDSRRKTGVQS